MSLTTLRQQISRLQAQVASAGIEGSSISVTHSRFGAGAGGDDVAKVNAALAYAFANDITRVHFPAGEYVFDCQNIAEATTLQALVDIAGDGMMVTGDGPHRTIIRVINATSTVGGQSVNCFGVTGQSNIIFDGLHFIGENDPYAYVFNNQGCCIRTHTSENIIIRNCRFESLFGFSAHDDGSERVHVLDCSFEDCANGPNVNADYSLQSRLTFKRSEGIEASGAFCVFADINIENAQGVGVSLGGNQGAEMPGSIASNITINGSTGNGMVLADGFTNAAISNVIIRKCAISGLVVFQDVQPVKNISFTNVIVDSNCAYPNLGTIVGADISGDGGHDFFNCKFTDQQVSGFRQVQAFSLNAPDCTVDGCRFQGSTLEVVNKDASFGTGCAGLRLGTNNRFENGTQEFLGAAGDIEANQVIGLDGTDVIYEFRQWQDSPGAGRRRFALTLGGKMTWGNGTDLADTTLYRNAADQLKTDDKFLATAGIGVGNSAAASAVGTLVKKVEIFDASGNSLGFVPVYSSIT
jgi:hypothetical protein